MKILLSLFCAIGLFASTLAFAVEKTQPLTSQMDAFLITVNDKGAEVLTPAEEAKPKDVIEYKLTYNNVSDNPLQNLIITGPIPHNTVYLGNTNATQINAQFVVSIDGGNTFESEPVKRTIEKDGEKVEVIIPPEKYTAVRWIPSEPINANEEQVFTYRIQVK